MSRNPGASTKNPWPLPPEFTDSVELTDGTIVQYGCIFDSRHGNVANMASVVELAGEHGFELPDTVHELLARWLSRRDIPNSMVEQMYALVDEAEAYLCELVPAGSDGAFGFSDGDFFFQRHEWWNESY